MNKYKEETNQDLTNSRRNLKDYLNRHLSHYSKLTKTERSKFLDTVTKIYAGAMRRDSISRYLQRYLYKHEKAEHKDILGVYEKLRPKKNSCLRIVKRRGRPPIYKLDDKLVWWLEAIWIDMDYVDPRHMHFMLADWIEHHREHKSVPEELKDKLKTISPSTIRRLMGEFQRRIKAKMHTRTQFVRHNNVTSTIATRVLGQRYTAAGQVDIDTVVHCGKSLLGTYAYTLNATDPHTHWTIQHAMMGKTEQATLESFMQIQKGFPYRIYGVHSDQGTEFMNHLFMNYLQRPHDFITQTKGRRYKSNDQAHIEQRNFTHVRKLFHSDRIDQQELIPLMNDIYHLNCLYRNFFFTTFKMVDKLKKNSRYIRVYNKPLTPFQRVLEDATVSQVVKDQLIETRKALNPFELNKLLKSKLNLFFKLLNNSSSIPDTNRKAA